jgi:small subunit ribosomal protein S7
MPRRKGKVVKRELKPDSKYSSVLVSKIMNKVMKWGKKRTAEAIVYEALEMASQQVKKTPVEVLEQAIKNVTPLLQVKARRVAGATYQVPMEVSAERGTTLAIRWLLDAARSRSGKSMGEKLAAELVDASHNQGAAAKKREDTHKMAEANRAFAHFRF